MESIGSKKCTKCGEVYPLSEYRRTGTTVRGEPRRRSECKICTRQYQARRSPEKRRLENQAYHERNRERMRGRYREYYAQWWAQKNQAILLDNERYIEHFGAQLRVISPEERQGYSPEVIAFLDALDARRLLITTDGKVLSRSKRRMGSISTWGYRTLKIGLGARRDVARIFEHRLVYLAVKGPIPDGFQINHIDGCKTNNHPNNLEVVTPKENVVHAVSIGLIRYENRKRHDSTIKDKIILMFEQGHTRKGISVDLSIPYSTVTRIISRK